MEVKQVELLDNFDIELLLKPVLYFTISYYIEKMLQTRNIPRHIELNV